MGLWHFGATALDRWVAKTVARYTNPAVERPARVLTWAADEQSGGGAARVHFSIPRPWHGPECCSAGWLL